MAATNKDETKNIAGALTDPLEDPYRSRKEYPPFDKTPASIYFYYIGPKDAGGSRSVKHYFYVHGYDTIADPPRPAASELEERVRLLAINARSGGNNPPQCGEAWKFIVWNHKSYLVILIDDPDIRFAPDAGLEFVQDNNGTPNHSFFDAREFYVSLSYPGGPQLAPALCCINHMKRNEAGDDLGDYPEFFNFVLHTNKQLGQRYLLDYPDAGGTNMGPPAPPPGFLGAEGGD